MENKQTAPKEIWVHNTDVKELNRFGIADDAYIHCIQKNMDNSDYSKYLSESSVKEMMAEKDRSINRMGDKLAEMTKQIGLIEKDIKKKDKEIERLKSELSDTATDNIVLKNYIEEVNRYLDDKGYPSQDRYGNTYSIIERIESN